MVAAGVESRGPRAASICEDFGARWTPWLCDLLFRRIAEFRDSPNFRSQSRVRGSLWKLMSDCRLAICPGRCADSDV